MAKDTPPRDPFVRSRGIKYPKDGNFITGQLRASLREDRSERKETDFVLKLVRHGEVVIKVGAGSDDFYNRPEPWCSTKMWLGADTPKYVEMVKVDVFKAVHVFKDIKRNILIADREGADGVRLPQSDLTGLPGIVMEAGRAYDARASTQEAVCYGSAC
jgi:hypothetical protein